MSKNRFMKKLLVAGLCALTATTTVGFVACGDNTSNTKEPTGQEAVNEYHVYFNLDGGTGSISTQTVTSGDKASKPTDPTKDGYTFAGWVLASDETDFSFDTVITSDITLKATWTAVTVTPPASGDNSTDNSGNNGGNTNEGNTNNGGNTNEGNTNGNTNEGDDHSGMTLKTVTNTYSYSAITGLGDKEAITSLTGDNSFLTVTGSVTYRNKAASSDGKSPDSIELKGDAVTVTFKGTGTLTLGVASTGSSNTSNIMLKDSEGNVITASSADGLTAVTEDKTIAEDFVNYAGSYEFSGTGTSTIVYTISKAGTYTIYSSYAYHDTSKDKDSARGCRLNSLVMVDNYYVSDKSFDVSFVTGEGASTIATTKVLEGDKVAQPAEPTREGYTFEGWYSDSACTEEFDFNTAISANTTIYAKWAEGTYIDLSLSFSAENLSTTTYANGWSSGIFSLTEGTTVSGRTKSGVYDGDTSVDSTFSATTAVKLGDSNSALKLNITATGVITLYVENGSSSNGSASSPAKQYLTITLPDNSTQDVEFQAMGNSSTIQKVTIDATQTGVYTVARKSGTSYLYYANFSAKVKQTAVESIEVSNVGTTEYYVGQSFDNTISVNAVHATTQYVEVLNAGDVTIDSSAFDSTKAGTYTIGVSYGDFTTSYTVKVYSFEGLTLGKNAIVKESKNTSAGNGVYANHALRQFYFTGEELDTDGLTVYLNGAIDNDTASFKLSATDYTVTGYDKTVKGAQTVTVSYTTNGTTKSETFTVYVQDKASSLSSATSVVLTVNSACDSSNIGLANSEGEYQFATIQQAINFLDNAGLSDNVTKTIKLSAGTYTERVEVNVANLTIEGAGVASTKIEYNSLYGEEDESGFVHVTDSTATLNVRESATGFTLKNVTVSNYYNTLESYSTAKSNDKRALAVLIMADKVTVDNCSFLGFQDTLELFTGRQYITNTYISGTTDFIFGTNNTTYFYNCEIHTIANGTKGGYVTAFKGYNKDASSDAVTYGAIFDNCTFTADTDVPEGKTALGRTWGSAAAVAVINSTLGAHISKDTTTAEGGRYVPMNGDPASANFVEYNNTGVGALASDATGYACTILDATTAANYSNLSVIFGATNGKYTYADAWNGSQGATVTTKEYNFADFDKAAEVISTADAPTTLFDGAIEIVGSSRMNGNSVQVKEGTVITLKVQGTITVAWFGSGYGSESDGKITYKDGYATLTIVGSENDVYIVSITVDSSKIPEDTVEGSDGGDNSGNNESDEYDYTKTSTIVLSDYSGATIEGSTGEYKGVSIDATSGKFKANGNSVQVNAGTVLSINVAEGAVVTVNWYQTYGSADDVTIAYNADHTVATLTILTDSRYIVSIDVTYTTESGSGSEGGEGTETPVKQTETLKADDYNDDYSIKSNTYTGTSFTFVCSAGGDSKVTACGVEGGATANDDSGLTFTKAFLPGGNSRVYTLTATEDITVTIYYTITDGKFTNSTVSSKDGYLTITSGDETTASTDTSKKANNVAYAETITLSKGESVTLTGSGNRLAIFAIVAEY
jgi:pectinesterase